MKDWSMWISLAITLAICAIFLFACGPYRPCWYNGKAVSQKDANSMKNLGMKVDCPGDEKD